MTKDELMAARWRITVCATYDSPGTVRTGRQWLNRYMLRPWERGSDFCLVTDCSKTPCINPESVQDSPCLK